MRAGVLRLGVEVIGQRASGSIHTYVIYASEIYAVDFAQSVRNAQSGMVTDTYRFNTNKHYNTYLLTITHRHTARGHQHQN